MKVANKVVAILLPQCHERSSHHYELNLVDAVTELLQLRERIGRDKDRIVSILTSERAWREQVKGVSYRLHWERLEEVRRVICFTYLFDAVSRLQIWVVSGTNSSHRCRLQQHCA